MVLLYRFSKARDSLKHKYDASNYKWMDVNSIISTVTMAHQPSSKLYALDSNHVECLAKFVFGQGSIVHDVYARPYRFILEPFVT